MNIFYSLEFDEEDAPIQNTGPEIAEIDKVVRMVFGVENRIEVDSYRVRCPEHPHLDGRRRAVWDVTDATGVLKGVFAYKIQDNLGQAFTATKRTLHDATLVDMIRDRHASFSGDVSAGIFIYERAVDGAPRIWFADCLNNTNPIHFERKQSSRNLNGDYFCIPTTEFPYPWNLHRIDRKSEQPSLLKPTGFSDAELFQQLKQFNAVATELLKRFESRS